MSDASRIWHHIRRHGICTSSEAAAALRMEKRLVLDRLRGLAEKGSVVKHEKSPNDTHSRVRFEVTDACKIPQGVTLREIIGDMEHEIESLHERSGPRQKRFRGDKLALQRAWGAVVDLSQ